MPFSMPIWPLVLGPVPRNLPAATPRRLPDRRRWVIVKQTVRREVDEAEYRAVLSACRRVEVSGDPRDDVVTSCCYLD
jgi:hypothetical protein